MLYSLLTALPQTDEPMKINITWTITAIIAVSSFLSPIFVAIINNRHHSKMRKLELAHDEQLRKLDLQQQNTIHQFDIYYADKKKAFSDFLQAAGDYYASKHTLESYMKVQATAHSALLFCNGTTQAKLFDFLEYVDTVADEATDSSKRRQYSATLSMFAVAMSEDLELAKPCINCE